MALFFGGISWFDGLGLIWWPCSVMFYFIDLAG